MGRSSGLGGIIEGITGEGGTLTGRGRGIPMPMFPTENIGMMSGAIRKKGKAQGGSRRSGRMTQVTMKDPKTGQMYGGLVKDGVPQFKAPDGSTPQGFPKDIDTSKIPVSRPLGDKRPIRERYSSLREYAQDYGRPAPSTEPLGKPTVSPPMERGAGARGVRQPPPGYKYDEIDRLVPIDTPPLGTPKPKFDPSKPSAVMETERVNVQDPTLGGPPEREVPIPKERDTSPRGRAPFSPDERAMARDAFFEKMFSRADERKQSRSMDQEERRNVMDARRDEAAMRDSERGMRNERGGRRRRGRKMRRRDFTRRRSRMEGRRSREERAAFRDQYVSTLR